MSAELHWQRPDAFHIRTDCNRYTVARVNVVDGDHYVAWRLGKPATEIGSISVRLSAPDSVRLEAIAAMQQRCVDDLLHVERKEAA